MVRMDLRVVTIDLARQEVMTRDNVPMTVDAVLYFRVIDEINSASFSPDSHKVVTPSKDVTLKLLT